MKMLLKKTAVLLSAAIMLSMTGCSGGSSSTSTDTQAQTEAAVTTAAPQETTTTAAEPEKPKELTLTPDSFDVKLIGRTLTENGTLWLAHSASGIEFTCTAKKLTINIKGDGAASGDENNQARFAVYVDGERTIDEMVDFDKKSFEIFSSESDVEKDVKIIKLSEPPMSSFGIESLVIESDSDSPIEPVPEKELMIEFIGDSITCGYGVDDEDLSHHFSTKTEDATKAYAYKTAQLLDADYSLVSYSGHGIISGYTSKATEKNESELVPPIYEQFSKTPTSDGFFNDDTPWDFSRYEPDYVVINLGTNDGSYTGNDKDKAAEYEEGYLKFIKTVKSHYPDAYVICILGTMGANQLVSSIENAAAAYTEETGDTAISVLSLPQQDRKKNGLAADWHPTEATHTETAELLAEYIRTLMNGEEPANAAA